MAKFKVTTADGTFLVTTADEGSPAPPVGSPEFQQNLGRAKLQNARYAMAEADTAAQTPNPLRRGAQPGEDPRVVVGRQTMGLAHDAVSGIGSLFRPAEQDYEAAPGMGLATVARRLGVDPHVEEYQHGATKLGAIPVVGPLAAQMGRDAGSGDYVGALANAAQLAALAKPAVSAGKGVGPKISSPVSSAAGALADAGVDSRLVNSTLGSKVKGEILIGKNPGQAVLDEGLVGPTTKRTLKDRIDTRANEVGQQINSVVQQNASTRIPLRDQIAAVFDNLIDNAATASAENGLTKLKEFWLDRKLNRYMAPDGTVGAVDAWKLKKDAGRAVNFKSLTADDAVANQALADTFHVIQEEMNQRIPGIEPLNSRYSNLIGASKALHNTLATDQTKAIFSLRSLAVATGATPAKLGTAALINKLKP